MLSTYFVVRWADVFCLSSRKSFRRVLVEPSLGTPSQWNESTSHACIEMKRTLRRFVGNNRLHDYCDVGRTDSRRATRRAIFHRRRATQLIVNNASLRATSDAIVAAAADRCRFRRHVTSALHRAPFTADDRHRYREKSVGRASQTRGFYCATLRQSTAFSMAQQEPLLSQRIARQVMSVEILSTAAQLYEKSHL